jgi:hypothetical protein
MEEDKKIKKRKAREEEEFSIPIQNISEQDISNESVSLPPVPKNKKGYVVVLVTKTRIVYKITDANYSSVPNTFEKQFKPVIYL